MVHDTRHATLEMSLALYSAGVPSAWLKHVDSGSSTTALLGYQWVVLPVLFFFFSSRRRHTRCSRDWSSDVCSSDLTMERFFRSHPEWRDTAALPAGFHWKWYYAFQQLGDESVASQFAAYRAGLRSEERRVGKECRSRWSPYH